MNPEQKQRKEILDSVTRYFKQTRMPEKFVPGESYVNYAGRVYDEKELLNLVDSSLDFWLTEGRFAENFSEKISDYLDIDNVILVNSGSSANLIAISALTSKKLDKRCLNPGDEVITVAAGFPATVTPIVQNRLIPVFVDVSLPTYNIDIAQLDKAVSSKTKAIFLAHTLGNPYNIGAVKEIAKKHNLWFIEDNCDAFGSKYNGKFTGTFGDMSTMSFYPAHHITTGEGGAVVTNNEMLAKIIRSFRDWGRDCYCIGGENNTCGKRFTQQFGTLPSGYDHKYVYSEIGYNLKMTDMQAAIGSAQMDKIDHFGKRRRENFRTYIEIFSKYEEFFILPKATDNSDPSWFTFIVSVKENAPFSRNDITSFFNENKIETRNIFAGNMIRQPAFADQNYRVSGELKNTDFIMNNTFFLGTYPGMTPEKFAYVKEILSQFIKGK